MARALRRCLGSLGAGRGGAGGCGMERGGAGWSGAVRSGAERSGALPKWPPRPCRRGGAGGREGGELEGRSSAEPMTAL